MKTLSQINIKEKSLQLNDYALKTTESTVLKTIKTTEKLQKLTGKSIQKSLMYSERQQDRIFNSLEKGKALAWKNINKTLDFFSKN